MILVQEVVQQFIYFLISKVTCLRAAYVCLNKPEKLSTESAVDLRSPKSCFTAVIAVGMLATNSQDSKTLY